MEKKTECKTIGDYHDLYLKSDVLILADVFEKFRKNGKEYCNLDPVHYFSCEVGTTRVHWPLIDEALIFLNLTAHERVFTIEKSTCCTAWSLVTVWSQHMIHCLFFKDSGKPTGSTSLSLVTVGTYLDPLHDLFDRWSQQATNHYIFCNQTVPYMTLKDRRNQQGLRSYV